MRRLAPLFLAALPAAAEPVAASSGQPLDLVEAFWDATDESAPKLRLRLIAPEIGAGRSLAEVEPDFLFVCETLALPRLPPSRRDALIVISFSDRPVPFGATAPEATQYFEAFRADAGTCRWEGL